VDADAAFDVIVVGGGITGVTAAYLLQRSGRRVALLERHRCLAGDTGHTSAHLSYVTDKPITALVKDIGEDHARAVWDAGRAATLMIGDIVRKERIECGFAWLPGYLHEPALDEADGAEEDRLRAEADLATALGFEAVYIETVPFIERAGVRFSEQARIHPVRYLEALLALVTASGGLVFEDSGVEEVTGDGPLDVRVNGRTLTCVDLVIGTHNPIVGRDSLLGATWLQTRLTLDSTYVVGGRVQKGRVPDALFWDTASPYRYLRLDPQATHDLVVFGGQDHKTGQVEDTDACYRRLETELQRLLPGVDVTHRWSGQVIATPDGLPFIGETAPHQFAATGFGGNGLTFGTVAAIMACDGLTATPNPWQRLFDIGRTGIGGGAWDYVRQNADYPYYLVRDRLPGISRLPLESLGPGQAMVTVAGGTRVAAWRDESGELVLRSAVCPHMGCLVRWNTAESTWDCPCHGSRFRPTGEVLSGPAERPLEPVTLEIRHATLSR
jgi:glycine/D-amino acid oxidase-like deaminating enzyme/nitrite reductase/ring-hydroxylating ferredoxin subunit